MRSSHLAIAAALLLAACGGNHIGDDTGDDAGSGGDDGGGGPCQGLACYQVACPGGGTTSISGTVYAPNGYLALYNVNVYVPNAAVPDFDDSHLGCDQCGAGLPGAPLVQAVTDDAGNFTLGNMPATDNVPLVIQIGRWRRQFIIPAVPQCTDTALNPEDIRLPKDSTEGHLPKIALTTGGADALECLVRKLGISDTEFGVAGETDKRVHLYAGNQSSSGGGTNHYDQNTDNGASFGAATTFWDTESNLENYDIVILSCEGNSNAADKPQTAIDNMNTYANRGGRVFASHWHNYWFQQPATGSTKPWSAVTTWDNGGGAIGDMTADINQTFDKGAALAQWLVNVNASSTLGQIELTQTKHTLTGVDETEADKWVYSDNPPDGSGTTVQYTSFTTPLESPADQRCGRAVFSDIHVAADDSDKSFAFPSGGCTTDVATMSAQEKVLAFMLFDIASCVGPVVN